MHKRVTFNGIEHSSAVENYANNQLSKIPAGTFESQVSMEILNLSENIGLGVTQNVIFFKWKVFFKKVQCRVHQ